MVVNDGLVPVPVRMDQAWGSFGPVFVDVVSVIMAVLVFVFQRGVEMNVAVLLSHQEDRSEQHQGKGPESEGTWELTQDQ